MVRPQKGTFVHNRESRAQPRDTKVANPNVWHRLREAVRAVASSVLGWPFPITIGSIALWTLVKNGFGVYPASVLELDIASALPNAITLHPDAQYLMYSLAGPVLARILGVTSIQGWVVLHAIVLATTFVALILTIRNRRGERAARISAVTLCSSAVPAVLLQWVGSYDAFTFALGSFLVVVESWPALLLVSVGLGMFHFEQGAVIVGLLVLLGASRRWSRLQLGLTTVSGLFLGKLVLTVYLSGLGIGATQARLQYMLGGPMPSGNYLQMALNNFPTLLYSVLGGAWFWLIVAVLIVGRDWKDMRLVPVALALGFLPALLTHDQTRVYAMVTAPVLLYTALLVDDHGSADEVDLVVSTALISLVVAPAVIVWEGIARVPTFAPFLRRS